MALVLVPTRELAMQISEVMHRYGRDLGARILPIYGGQPIGRQLRALERGVDVVVATPGRAIDHITRQTLGLGSLQVVVLDEADEMLDMGFAEDIEAILGHTPQDRQTVLFAGPWPACALSWWNLDLAKEMLTMQAIWMVLVTLGLALSGVLGLALVTRVISRTRRR